MTAQCGCAGIRQLAAPSSGSWAKAKVIAHREKVQGTGQMKAPSNRDRSRGRAGSSGFEVRVVLAVLCSPGW